MMWICIHDVWKYPSTLLSGEKRPDIIHGTFSICLFTHRRMHINRALFPET